MPVLQFSTFVSSPSPAFFHALAKLKLDTLKLDDSLLPVWGRYSEGRFVVDKSASFEDGSDKLVGLPGVVELDAESLVQQPQYDCS